MPARGVTVVPPLRVCEDCAGVVEEGVDPIGLFRRDPHARRGVVWDETKQRWVSRPRNAAAGGRRWAEWLLCRRCRAEVLRRRSLGGTVTVDGRKRALRTRERVPPRKGGRPRLLDDGELDACYRLYLSRGWSMVELARRLAAAREAGTVSGYTQSLLYGWRRLGYRLRPRGVQIGISRHGTDGSKSKPQMRRCARVVKWGERRGKRCRLFAMRDSRFCGVHQEGR